jgi:hypothetical protein
MLDGELSISATASTRSVIWPLGWARAPPHSGSTLSGRGEEYLHSEGMPLPIAPQSQQVHPRTDIIYTNPWGTSAQDHNREAPPSELLSSLSPTERGRGSEYPALAPSLRNQPHGMLGAQMTEIPGRHPSGSQAVVALAYEPLHLELAPSSVEGIQGLPFNLRETVQHMYGTESDASVTNVPDHM